MKNDNVEMLRKTLKTDQYNFKEFCRNFSFDNVFRYENQKEIGAEFQRIEE